MDERYHEALEWCRSMARDQGIDAALQEYCVDVLVVPCSRRYIFPGRFAISITLSHSQRVDLHMHGRVSLTYQYTLHLSLIP
jgi:hypothetical protein